MRTAEMWFREVVLNTNIVLSQVKLALQGDLGENPARDYAYALKEVRRTESDIYRMAKEVSGVSKEEIDAIGLL